MKMVEVLRAKSQVHMCCSRVLPSRVCFLLFLSNFLDVAAWHVFINLSHAKSSAVSASLILCARRYSVAYGDVCGDTSEALRTCIATYKNYKVPREQGCFSGRGNPGGASNCEICTIALRLE